MIEWVEAEAVTSITEKEIHKFIWKNTIKRFRFPIAIVSIMAGNVISTRYKTTVSSMASNKDHSCR